MKELIRKLWDDESGATMVEYGLMVALIAIVCIAAVSVLGENTRDTFQVSSAALAQTNQSACESAGGSYTPTANGADGTAGTPDDIPDSCTF